MRLDKAYTAILFLLLILSSRLAHAQFTIPDPNFRQFLVTTYPSVMNGDETLNIAAANALSVMFKCSNKGITNLSGIEYFTSITSLEVKNNPALTSVPNIDGLTSVTIVGLDSNGLTSLPNLSTLVNVQILSVRHNQLSTVPNISTLIQLKILFMDNNLFTTLPNLSNQVNLEKIICSDNPITSLPSFSTLGKLSLLICQRTNLTAIPSLSGCVLLEYLICTNNNVTVIPSLAACTILKELKIFRCKLTSLPDLSMLPLLYVVNAHVNELSYEDIQPLTGMSFYAASSFSPQSPGTANTINTVQLSSVTLNLGFDNSISNSTYTWYKDGVLLTTTSVNNLTINPVGFNNDGIYTCIVTNTTPALSTITLNAQPITLKVSPCVISNSIDYTVQNTECTYPINVVINENSFTAGTSPYTYVVKNNIENKAFNSSNILLSIEGTYDLVVTDATGCEVTFASKLIVNRNTQCDPIFYPNGDGVADTYYIENTGNAKIYDKSGVLIKDLTIPGNWDGTNTKGELVESGLYLIVINANFSIPLTLIR